VDGSCQSGPLLTLIHRLRCGLAGFVAGAIYFARRSNARFVHFGPYFVRDAFAGQTLTFGLLLCRIISVLAYLFRFLELLSRKLLGLLFKLIASLAHELVLSLGSRQ
jgi:hypothetical protein